MHCHADDVFGQGKLAIISIVYDQAWDRFRLLQVPGRSDRGEGSDDGELLPPIGTFRMDDQVLEKAVSPDGSLELRMGMLAGLPGKPRAR